jgi:hypothetical protein
VTASRAYIAGIGTTGVLIGFALLMLAVVSALVAFRGWPGDAVMDGAGAVTVGGESRLVEIEPVRLGEEARTAEAAAAPGTRAPAPGSSRATGGRFDVRGVSQSESARLEPGSDPATTRGQAETPSAKVPQGGGEGVTGGVVDSPAGSVGEVVTPVTGGPTEVGGGLGETVGGVGGSVQEKTGELGLPRLPP